GLARKAPFRRKHADASTGGDMTLEIGLIAEQPKPALDLPLDAQRSAAAPLGTDGVSRRREHGRGEAENADATMAHGVGERLAGTSDKHAGYGGNLGCSSLRDGAHAAFKPVWTATFCGFHSLAVVDNAAL